MRVGAWSIGSTIIFWILGFTIYEDGGGGIDVVGVGGIVGGGVDVVGSGIVDIDVGVGGGTAGIVGAADGIVSVGVGAGVVAIRSFGGDG